MAIAPDVRYQLRRRVLSADEEDGFPHHFHNKPKVSFDATDEPRQVPQCTCTCEDINIFSWEKRVLFQHCLNCWLHGIGWISGCIWITEEVTFVRGKLAIDGRRRPRRRFS